MEPIDPFHARHSIAVTGYRGDVSHGLRNMEVEQEN